MSKNRIISSDRVRKFRKPKTKILIAVEGKNKTEKNYFNNFENGQRPYNISYARGTNTDPLNLVTMLIKEIKNWDSIYKMAIWLIAYLIRILIKKRI